MKGSFVSRSSSFYVLLSLILLFAQMVWAQVDFTTLSNKVMTGYQMSLF